MQGSFPLCLTENSQPEVNEIMAEGFFRSKKGFTVVQNEITRDSEISLKAKWTIVKRMDTFLCNLFLRAAA